MWADIHLSLEVGEAAQFQDESDKSVFVQFQKRESFPSVSECLFK